MLGWLVVLFIITLCAGIIAFGGFSQAMALIGQILFFTFAIIFCVGVFVFFGTRGRMKK